MSKERYSQSGLDEKERLSVSPERLQKVLASAGIASRRDCEELIAAGRVMVNGRVVTVPGTRVDLEHDEVLVDGQPLRMPAKRTYIMLHKPAGVVSTAEDTHGRPTVVDLVDVPARVFPVGRLDLDSEGLILLTDDGELAHALTHPSFEVEKEYRVLLDRALTPDALRSWRNGVLLDGEMTAPAWVELIGTVPEGVWVRIVLREGRKRQIRAVAKLLGYEVLRLIRVREGELELGDLPPRAWRHLTDEEVAALRAHIPTRWSVPERSRESVPAAWRGSGSAEAVRESPVASERAPRAQRVERSVPRERSEERPPRSRSDERGSGRGWREERPPRSRSDERGSGRGWREERPPRSRSDERGAGRGGNQARREPPSRRSSNTDQSSQRRSERTDQSTPDSRRRDPRPRRYDDQE